MGKYRDRLRAENRWLRGDNERLFKRVNKLELDCKTLEKMLHSIQKRIVHLSSNTSVSCAMLLTHKDSEAFAKYIERQLARGMAEELFANGAVGLLRKDEPETCEVVYKARLEVLMPEKKVISWPK